MIENSTLFSNRIRRRRKCEGLGMRVRDEGLGMKALETRSLPGATSVEKEKQEDERRKQEREKRERRRRRGG